MNIGKTQLKQLLMYLFVGMIALACTTQTLFAQDTAKRAKIYPKSQWGTLSADKQMYVSVDGKVVLNVGDTIVLGKPSSVANTYSAIHYAAKKKHNVFNVLLNQNSEPLSGQYVGQRYVIETFSVSSNSTMFGGPKVAYLYFSVTKRLPAEVIIEQALAADEFRIDR